MRDGVNDGYGHCTGDLVLQAAAAPEAPEAYARVAVGVGVHVAAGPETEGEASVAEVDGALGRAKDRGADGVATSGSRGFAT